MERSAGGYTALKGRVAACCGNLAARDLRPGLRPTAEDPSILGVTSLRHGETSRRRAHVQKPDAVFDCEGYAGTRGRRLDVALWRRRHGARVAAPVPQLTMKYKKTRNNADIGYDIISTLTHAVPEVLKNPYVTRIWGTEAGHVWGLIKLRGPYLSHTLPPPQRIRIRQRFIDRVQHILKCM